MGTRRQWTGRFTFTKVGDAAANAADAGTTNSAAFDTNLSESPSLHVDIVNLAQNKKLKFKLQESSESNANFTDVPLGLKTNVNPATEINANGVQKYWYAGEKRYVRLVVTSVGAAPAATCRVYGILNNLAHVPENTGI